MSKTVDERVVSMQFDNEHFERNVKTTMSTLDRLKQSLNLSGSAKGLENIGTAAKNVNMSSLGNAVETVRTKFSALEVMGVTALANITNSAVNAGKRIVKSLTIAPIKSGFDEYELKMGSIQTIMAGTGESLETVNKYLDELNTYSDQTIYSFQDMTSNIGKFTNAGVKLEDAVMAIKGISNEAAVSGANANEASRAMYNFAQALSSGYVKLIDWKSIELANMATVEFKNQLIASAVAAGTLKDAGDGMYETLEGKLVNATTGFNDSLQDQWMTTEVLISTLKDYADEGTDIGKKAKAAATEVKTFSMMMDTLKESVQSGWARTWEILVGDFEEAKRMWTSVSNVLGGVIEKISGARNDFLEKVFGERDTSSWEKLTSKITEAGGSIKDFEESVKKVAKKHGVAIDDMIKEEGSFNKTLKKGWLTKDIYTQALDDYAKSMEGVSGATGDANESLAYFQKMFDEVWRGNWDNGRKRIELLTEAGHDYAAIQKLVNEHTAGSTLTMEDLSDAQLKNIGLTKDQIDLFRELADQAKESGSTIEEEINNLSKRSGRDLMIESIVNFVKEFGKIGTAIKEAWTDVFGDIDIADGIYGAIEALHNLSENFTISEERAGQFKTIMQGALAGFNLSFGVFGKGVVFSLKLLSAVLEVCGTDLLELGDTVAGYIINLKDWVYEHTLVGNSLNKLAKIIVAVVRGIHDCIKAFLDLDIIGDTIRRIGEIFRKVFGSDFKFDKWNIDEFVENITTAFDKLEELIKGIDGSELARNIIDGLLLGLETGLSWVVNGIKNLATALINAFADCIQSHSPSLVFFEFGKNIVQGLIKGIAWLIVSAIKIITDLGRGIIDGWNSIDFDKIFSEDGYSIFDGFVKGIQNGASHAWGVIKKIGTNLYKVVKDLNFGAIFAGALSVGALVISNKLLNVMELFAGIPQGIKALGSGIGNMFESIGKAKIIDAKAKSWEKKSKAILNMAISIGILAASIALLCKLDKDDMWDAVEILTALSVILVALSIAATKLGGATKKGKSFNVQALSIVAIAGSLLIVAMAMQRLAGITPKDMNTAIKGLAAMIGGMVTILLAYGLINAKGEYQMIDKAGKMLFKMSLALMVMVGVIKLASMLDESDIRKGIGVAASMLLLFSGVVILSKFSGEHADKAGKMLLRMSIAMLIMVGVVALAGQMDKATVEKGLIFVAGVEALFLAVVALSKLVGENSNKAGTMLFRMSLAMLTMIGVIKLASGLKEDEIKRGLAIIGAIGLLFAGIIAVFNLTAKKESGGSPTKMGIMLMSMATAILMLTTALYLIAFIPEEGLWRSASVVSILLSVFGLLILATSTIKSDVKGMTGVFIAITVAITMLALAIVALSFLDRKDVAVAGATLAGVITAFSLLIRAVGALNTNKKAWTKALISIVVMTAVVTALAYLITKMSCDINPEAALPAAGALSLLLIAMAGAFRIIARDKCMSKENVVRTALMLGAMTIVVAVLGEVIKGLSTISNPAGAIVSAASISLLLIAMAGAMRIIDRERALSKENLTRTSMLLGAMTLVVIALAHVIGPLSNSINIKAAMPAVLALSALLYALVGAVKIATIGKSVRAENLGGLVGMLVMMSVVVGVLAIIVNELSNNINVQAAIPAALALSTLLFALVGAMKIATLGVAIGPDALGGFAGMLLVMTVVVGLLAVIVSELSNNVDAETALPAVASLSVLLLAMAGVTAILSKFGAGSMTAATEGAFALGAVITIVTTIMLLIGELIGLIPESDMARIEAGLDRLVFVMAKLGEAVGAIIGGFIYGIGMGVMSLLPAIGEALSDFMEECQGFITGLGGIKGDVLGGAGILAGAIIALGAAGFIESILDINPFKDSLPSLGTSLSEFMSNCKDFIDGATALGQNHNMMIGIKTLAEAVLALTAADFIESISNPFGIFGDSSLGSFSAQLPQLGKDLSTFAGNLGEFSQDQVNSIRCASEAVATIAKAANDIPNEGGWAAKIFGDNGLGTFGAYLPTLGTQISSFAKNLGTFGEDQIATITCAADVIRVLARTASEIPNEGGWASKLFGDNSIGTWGTYLPTLGTQISSFAKNLGTFGEEQLNAVDYAAKAITAIANASNAIPNEGDSWIAKICGDNSIGTWGSYLPDLGTNLAGFATNIGMFGEDQVNSAKFGAQAIAEMAKVASDLPNEGGWLSKLVGDNSIATFGGYLPGLGANIKGFVTNIGTFTSKQVETVNAAVGAINSFASLAATDLWTAASNIKKFGDKISKFGEDLADFCAEMMTIEAFDINVAISRFSKIIGAIKEITSSDVTIVKDFSDALKKLASDGVANFAKSFTSDDAKATVKAATKDLMNTAIEGFKSKSEDAKTAADDIVDEVYDAIKTKANYQDFNDAGKYLVLGFADGIEKNTWQAEAKARDMAAAAAEAAKSELDEHSPSKVGYRIGDFFGIAFVNAIGNYASKAYNASAEMASNAKTGLSDAIAKISRIIDSDIDCQPTIRPVLDLSNVNSGIDSMNNMFATSHSVGVMANVGAISTAMNNRNQNGANAELISEIRSLKASMGNHTENYNINGITYDDGSNVSDAVRTLVRAAKVERRI